MKPVSKFSIILTIIAVIIIGWVVFTHQNPTGPVVIDPNTQPVTVSWPSVEVDKKTISDENQYYTIDVTYPVTKDVAINDKFKAFAEDQIVQFKEDTAWVMDPAIESAAEGTLSLTIDYREERSTHADNYIFTISTYTGGAHGLQITKTFAFDAVGTPIMQSDLFANPDTGLKAVAAFVQKEIEKKKISDAEWIKDGAGATPDNYQSFIISDAGVTFIFDPYQVAPYAAGTQNILVPFTVFKASPKLIQ